MLNITPFTTHALQTTAHCLLICKPRCSYAVSSQQSPPYIKGCAMNSHACVCACLCMCVKSAQIDQSQRKMSSQTGSQITVSALSFNGNSVREFPCADTPCLPALFTSVLYSTHLWQRKLAHICTMCNGHLAII